MISVSLTIFKSKYDNKTHKRMDFDNFEEFALLLNRLSTKRYYQKADAPLISPATYVKGEKRRNVNVLDWGGWACLDVDDWEVSPDELNEKVLEKFGKYRFICYSTASSLPTQPKFRLVFALTKRIPKDDIPHFWHALNTEAGLIGDKQVKDLSRMYYVPAEYHTSVNTYNFIFSNEGEYMNPDELMEKHPMAQPQSKNFLDRLPESTRNQIIEYRKSKLQNTEYSWTSYHNCPFFPKKMAQEYKMITNTGWYAKLYQIMVATASRAVEKGYPISSKELADLVRELDNETGGWYANRPLELEADRALEYVYRNM